MAAVDDQHPVQQFAAEGPNPSFGDRVRPRCPHRRAQDTNTCTGEHGIEHAGELAVAVPDQQPELSCAVAEVHQQSPRLLGYPGAVGVGSDSENADAAGRVFDHEQHIQSLQQRVDAEEVGGENAPGLSAQELPPAGPVAARGGIDAGPLENRLHGTGRDLVAKPGQFAMDAPISPGGVVGGQPQHQPAQLGWGAPAAGAVTPVLDPAPLHQVPVPPQNRGRGDDPMRSAGLG